MVAVVYSQTLIDYFYWNKHAFVGKFLRNALSASLKLCVSYVGIFLETILGSNNQCIRFSWNLLFCDFLNCLLERWPECCFRFCWSRSRRTSWNRGWCMTRLCTKRVSAEAPCPPLATPPTSCWTCDCPQTNLPSIGSNKASPSCANSTTDLTPL